MKIALAVDGTRGDVEPMLWLGESLRETGHRIVVCGPPDFAEAIAERGFEHRPVGEPVQAYLVDRAAVITRGGLAMLREAMAYTRRSVQHQLDTLTEGFSDIDFAFGAGVQVGAATAAERHRIPYRYVAYCPIVFPSRQHPPPSVERQDRPQWLNPALWWISGFVLDRMLKRRVDRFRRRLGLPALRDLLSHMLSTRPVLAADAELGALPDDVAVPVERVPCLHRFEPRPLPDKLESFLASGPPPIYLGFGSMTDPRPEETTRRLVEAISRLGLRAVLSAGWAGLGGGALPDEVFVTGPVSHAALFPRCAAIVHHGGAGTTTTAARAGVPQVIVPHVVDQYYWARRVGELGIGVSAVARRGLTPEALVGAIGETVSAEVVVERASQLGETLRRRASDRSGFAALLQTSS